jgi:hypothetical protein
VVIIVVLVAIYMVKASHGGIAIADWEWKNADLSFS